MDTNAILTIVSAALGFVALIAGGFLAKSKGKLSEVVGLGKELVDVVETFEAAVIDNTITPEELTALKKEMAEVKVAFKILISKE